MIRRWMQDTILDKWAYFDYKPSFLSVIPPTEIPSWIAEDDSRRLRAYAMIDAYVRNKSRIWLRAMGGVVAEDEKDRREYGDPELLVETALSSLLGTGWSVTTENAISGQDGAEPPAQAVAQQKWLEQWMKDERVFMKIIESETQSIKFGDSVFVLGWNPKKERVAINVHDPSFYFPEFDARDGGTEEFPKKVAICWEFEEERGERTEVFVRRIEWMLSGFEDDTENSEGETCWYRDGIWALESAVDGFRGSPLELLNEEAGEDGWTDLEIDFIPVVHMPNSISLQEHFGTSILANVFQLLDDIQSTDTDLQAAAATTGSPPIAVGGTMVSGTTYGPGTLISTGDGTAQLLDTSGSLDALLKLKDALLERLAVNSRTPESLLGRVKPNEVPSGIALTLSFTPHSGMIEKMRLVRDYKYQMLFRFAMRLHEANGGKLDFKIGENASMIKFGSYLPSDMQEAMTIVMNLYSAKVISLETAVQILVDRGYPIENWLQEIKRIEMRDLETAQGIATLTGNLELGAARLGIAAKDVVGFEDQEADPAEDGDPTV